MRSGSLTGKRYPDSLLHPDKIGFQPRIGISWRPFLASSMVVRAGYGVYYDTSVYLPIVNRMTQQSPLSKSLSVQNSPQNPLTLANGFNAPPSLIPNTFAVDPEFPGRVFAELAGFRAARPAHVAGDDSRRTWASRARARNSSSCRIPFPQAPRILARRCPAGFAYLTSNGNSTRHSGTVQLRRRLHNGFTAPLQYTYAQGDRQRGARRDNAGRRVDRAGLAEPERRAGPFQLRSAASAERHHPIHHRNGHRRRNPAGRMEGRAVQGLDLRHADHLRQRACR